jgi:hypothetical protein
MFCGGLHMGSTLVCAQGALALLSDVLSGDSTGAGRARIMDIFLCPGIDVPDDLLPVYRVASTSPAHDCASVAIVWGVPMQDGWWQDVSNERTAFHVHRIDVGALFPVTWGVSSRSWKEWGDIPPESVWASCGGPGPLKTARHIDRHRSPE